MTDDYEDFTVAARFDRFDEAQQAVARLTERGIGAMVDPMAGASGGDHGGRFELVVVPDDVGRACEILGIAVPTEAVEAASRREKRRLPQWAYVLIVFAVAMVVIPGLAFFLSFKLSGG